MTAILKDVTICLITCGEDTEKECVSKLNNDFPLIEIRNVYPQSAACNEMIKQVNTPFLIPLDSDIFLYKNYSERILNVMSKFQDDPYLYQILFPLWDPFFRKKIKALKLMKTSFLKYNLYQDVRVPDVEHFLRMLKLGFHHIDLASEQSIGNHVIRGNKTCYAKLKDTYLSYRKNVIIFGHRYAKYQAQEDFNFFSKMYNETKNDDYLYAIAGMLDGLQSKTGLNESKDYRKFDMSVLPDDAIRYFRKKMYL